MRLPVSPAGDVATRPAAVAGPLPSLLGPGLLASGLLTAAVFGLGSAGQGPSVFRLSRPNDPLGLPDLAVPADLVCYGVAIVLAVLGAWQMLHGFRRRRSLVLGASMALVVAAFMVWATAGKSFSLTGLLQASVVHAVPIALAGIAGLLSERVAVMNIAVEGMLLAGAFAGALVGSLLGGPLGLVAAIAAGAALGLVLAALVVACRVDQIIAGVVVNIFVLGATSYVSSQVFSQHRALNNAPVFRAIDVPLLGDLPVIGPVLVQQTLFVHGTLLIVAASSYYLFRTRHGLRGRSFGEHPRAADTLGIDVHRTQYLNVGLAGMVAGFGGAWFTLGSVGRFDSGMTGGLGFIGLAAMIFGRWRPLGVLFAALIFGCADSLQQKLAILKTPIPSEFLAMAPYLATIVLVAGLVGRARPPAAIGKSYRRQ